MENKPTLLELVDTREAMLEELRTISARAAELKDIIDGIETLIRGWLPEGADSITVKRKNGVEVKFAWKNSTKYRTAPSRADDFYNFVRETGKIELLTRAIKQSAITDYVRTTGAVPPGIEAYIEADKVSVTYKNAAPSI